MNLICLLHVVLFVQARLYESTEHKGYSLDICACNMAPKKVGGMSWVRLARVSSTGLKKL